MESQEQELAAHDTFMVFWIENWKNNRFGSYIFILFCLSYITIPSSYFKLEENVLSSSRLYNFSPIETLFDPICVFFSILMVLVIFLFTKYYTRDCVIQEMENNNAGLEWEKNWKKEIVQFNYSNFLLNGVILIMGNNWWLQFAGFFLALFERKKAGIFVICMLYFMRLRKYLCRCGTINHLLNLLLLND